MPPQTAKTVVALVTPASPSNSASPTQHPCVVPRCWVCAAAVWHQTCLVRHPPCLVGCRCKGEQVARTASAALGGAIACHGMPAGRADDSGTGKHGSCPTCSTVLTSVARGSGSRLQAPPALQTNSRFGNAHPRPAAGFLRCFPARASRRWASEQRRARGRGLARERRGGSCTAGLPAPTRCAARFQQLFSVPSLPCSPQGRRDMRPALAGNLAEAPCCSRRPPMTAAARGGCRPALAWAQQQRRATRARAAERAADQRPLREAFPAAHSPAELLHQAAEQLAGVHRGVEPHHHWELPVQQQQQSPAVDHYRQAGQRLRSLLAGVGDGEVRQGAVPGPRRAGGQPPKAQRRQCGGATAGYGEGWYPATQPPLPGRPRRLQLGPW